MTNDELWRIYDEILSERSRIKAERRDRPTHRTDPAGPLDPASGVPLAAAND